MIRALILVVLLFAGGFVAWSLMEYLLHRFAMHHLRGKGIMSREHLRHHARSHWYLGPSNIASWAGVGIVSGAVYFPIGWLIAGVSGGIALSLGYVVGYFTYEWIHARAHLVGPTNAYTRWVRKSHFHHHFGHPMANHGVTSPVWDKIFGSYEEPGQVRIPRRFAMRWLLDSDGEVKPELADDYVVVGAGGSVDTTVDRERAFANLVPLS